MRAAENRSVRSLEPNFSVDFLRLQSEQHRHDTRNHLDIACRHKNDRLKHYGLHYSKYVGRFARGSDEDKSIERTLVDAFLICLSAANTLHQNLGAEQLSSSKIVPMNWWYSFADAAGRFGDACEKIDHMEEFVGLARQANLDIASWLVSVCESRGFDLISAIKVRREELVARQFYIQD